MTSYFLLLTSHFSLLTLVMALTGTFDDLSFAELLQLLNLGHKSGTLKVAGPQEQAVVHLLEGDVIAAKSTSVAGEEVIYRLLGMPKGEFEFSRHVHSVPRAINQSAESLILEGLRRLDELKQIEQDFAQAGAVLRITHSVVERYQELPQEARRMLRLVDAKRTVAQVIKESGVDPATAAGLIDQLIEQGFLEAYQPPAVDASGSQVHFQGRLPIGSV